MRTLRTALTLGLLSIAAPAAADDSASPGTPFPTTATLDRQTDHTSFNTAIGMSFYGDGGPDLGIRWDLYGQYVAPQGFGGYLTLPVSYVSGDDESETAIGNLELGGVYVAPAGAATDVVVRGGLVIDTSGDEDAFINLFTLIPRMTDLPSVTTEMTWLRLSASPLHRAGKVFVRADLGLDIAIDEPDGSDVDPFFHINLAAGIDAGPVTVAGEIVTVGTTGDVDEDEDRFLHTLAVSVSGAAGGVRPYGALILPVENELSEDFLDVSLALMVGLEVPMTAK
jgi:hypothetical protein